MSDFDAKEWADQMDAIGKAEYVTMLWHGIESAPTLKSIWVATKYEGHDSGFMEPCYRTSRVGPWKNTYTLDEIDWEPTHWMPFPQSPQKER